MKTLLFWPALILSIIGIATAACGKGDDAPGTGDGAAKLNVVATTVQITALAREVGGDKIDLHGIIPAGADAHEYEPTASDLRAVEGADVILRHGMGLDDWIEDTLGAGDVEPVTVTEGITVQKGEEDGETIDDPHVWHDPTNDKVIVGNIAEALGAADPDNKSAYDANAAAYKQTLDETRDQVQAIINEIPEENRKLVTNHDAFGYFARAFGLEVVGAVIPSVSTGSEPSAEDTAALLDTIEREGVKAIFAESSVNPGLATTLANDAGVTIVDDLYGDSLGEPGSGADTVHGMLLANARKIADALK
ncbi:MAG: zinc ABC transporter substrate-binding protein [Chloroflexota bacterium]